MLRNDKITYNLLRILGCNNKISQYGNISVTKSAQKVY